MGCVPPADPPPSFEEGSHGPEVWVQKDVLRSFDTDDRFALAEGLRGVAHKFANLLERFPASQIARKSIPEQYNRRNLPGLNLAGSVLQ